ncbi:MAG TPA: sulfurtransferase [Steroidobacteraceae bacterium]|nr:sulfurtransferase [Steroidobacteraceae bacterium]
MTQRVIVSVTELCETQDDPELVVLDCRFELADPDWGRRAYTVEHLPGAQYVHLNDDLSGPVTANTGRHPLPDPAQFANTLSRLGVGPDSRVVAYDQTNGFVAARLWWLLRARGHERVQVLDGGFAAWRTAGLPLERHLPQVTPQRAVVRPYTGLANTAAVAAALRDASILLVDARAADRFAGRNETLDPVAGHIPGAVNHPYAQNLDQDGQFLPAAELHKRWLATLAGRSPDQLVAMCGSGVTACHNLLALELAGLPGGRLYPGSFSEWIRDPLRPVVT